MKEEIFELKLEGYCCSQIIAEISLRRMRMENSQLVEAFAGLCDGVKCGRICGVVSAAVCIMYLADGREAERGLVRDYLDWFEEAFGALDCSELLGDDPMAKLEKCPMMVESTLLKLEELLEWE
ncbi:MAG TPA: C_GCAxxG_C_C family protein [Candidatus Copromorpha excrementigallinarum]|uniref:C_GCAxxG_C_C family protein n=1 Tax=Candidatus Allocopromorpha excrementigallinarum TaxID=2840742 RepID=A0A9D1HZL6_9FIRM|nr:C_GCAxxG_C_C family protein [Candidatus Copromorpha excrementigallinarum]